MVYVYDRVISFDQEVEVVWNRKITLVTALYTCMHFLTFTSLFIPAFLWLYDGPCEVSSELHAMYNVDWLVIVVRGIRVT